VPEVRVLSEAFPALEALARAPPHAKNRRLDGVSPSLRRRLVFLRGFIFSPTPPSKRPGPDRALLLNREQDVPMRARCYAPAGGPVRGEPMHTVEAALEGLVIGQL
jgi:hypothetical protein